MCNAKSFAMVVILYLSFFSIANLDGLVKVVSLFFVMVALDVCVTNIGLINMSCAFMPCLL